MQANSSLSLHDVDITPIKTLNYTHKMAKWKKVLLEKKFTYNALAVYTSKPPVISKLRNGEERLKLGNNQAH